MTEITKYRITMQYETVHSTDSEIWASSKEQAEQIALAAFKESHTEICKNPVVTAITEAKP